MSYYILHYMGTNGTKNAAVPDAQLDAGQRVTNMKGASKRLELQPKPISAKLLGWGIVVTVSRSTSAYWLSEYPEAPVAEPK